MRVSTRRARVVTADNGASRSATKRASRSAAGAGAGEGAAPHVLRRRLRPRVEDPQQSVVRAAAGEEARQGDLPAVWIQRRQGAPCLDRARPPASDRAARKAWRAGRPRWEADHIVPVADGGGECGLENYRLLCRPCHVAVTLAWRARRTRSRVEAPLRRTRRHRRSRPADGFTPATAVLALAPSVRPRARICMRPGNETNPSTDEKTANYPARTLV